MPECPRPAWPARRGVGETGQARAVGGGRGFVRTIASQVRSRAAGCVPATQHGEASTSLSLERVGMKVVTYQSRAKRHKVRTTSRTVSCLTHSTRKQNTWVNVVQKHTQHYRKRTTACTAHTSTKILHTQTRDKLGHFSAATRSCA